LIGVDANLAFAFSNERAKKSICKIVERQFAGSVRGFTKSLGFSSALDAQLTNSRRRRFVGLKMLLTVAFVSGVSIIDLLTQDDALYDFIPAPPLETTYQSRQRAAAKTAILSALAAAAKEIPPPSLVEVAARLGLTRTRLLRSHSPETCDLINQRYLNSERGKETRRWPRKRLRSNADIKTALEAALNEESPPSVTQVAHSLGYRTDISIMNYFPELCRALNQRQPKDYLARRKTVETELNRSLQSDLPEEPRAVAKRLGYRSTHRLRITYSQPFKRIRDRYEAHKKAQFLSEMRTQLDAAHTQVPPPTLKDTARKLGVSDGWLRKHFPDERSAIAARSLRHREEQAAMNKASDRDRLKTIVNELYADGTFPSMNAVLDVFTASTLKRAEVWAIIKNAREAL
jgi:AraC-like DNA-binding protein